MIDNIPSNIKTNVTYYVYLGVGNHMGLSTYYTCYVKLRNQTEPLPNATDKTPSPLPPLYQYNIFIKDGQAWEAPLMFQVNNASFSGNESQLKSITINGVAFTTDEVASWNSESNGYFYNLFVELWIFNSTSGAFQFHNRFVGFSLNMTQQAQ
jgi:hypothetical protein